MSGVPVNKKIHMIPGLHAPQKMILEWMSGKPLRGQHVLDIGCGTTYLSAGLAKLTGATVHVVDRELLTLEVQTSRFKHQGVERGQCFVCDIGRETLPTLAAAPHVTITCFNCHQHLPAAEESAHLLAEVRRRLLPGDSFILADRVSEKGETYWWGSRGDPMWVRTVPDLQQLLEKAGFQIKTTVGFKYEFNTDVSKEWAEWCSLDQALVAIMEMV